MDLLSFLVFLPIFGAVIVLCSPKHQYYFQRNISLLTAVIQVISASVLLFKFERNNPQTQFVTKFDWITLKLPALGSYSIDYYLALDGINIWLVVLSTIVFTIAIISGWSVSQNSKAYYTLLLVLNTSILGCFLAFDLFLFFVFFEFMLLPMYFLIGLWGGANREYASIKFFLYTLAGSLGILIAIIGLASSAIDPLETAKNLNLSARENSDIIAIVQSKLLDNQISSNALVHTFDILHLSDKNNYLSQSIFSSYNDFKLGGLSGRNIIFLCLFIGFLVKIPSVPLHTWLPDAHVEASTPISILLAALLLKTGTYGFMRIGYTVFPDQIIQYAWLIAGLGVVSILYAAFNALAMNDLKKMIAYSSVSHMGFVLLGIAAVNPVAGSGAVFQMVSHGIISAALFLIVGVLYDRTHNRNIDSYRGLASKMPIYTSVVVISFFASLGLPGFSGFIGEVLVLLGAFASSNGNGLLSPWYAATATFGIFIGAAFYLWTIQRMFFGKFWVKNGSIWSQKLKDINYRERLMLFPLILLMLIFGLAPNLMLDNISISSNYLIQFVLDSGKAYLQK